MIDISIYYLSIIPFFIFILLFLKFGRRDKNFPYYSCEKLLTTPELKFYDVLDKVIPNSQSISCKVRLADIIQCSQKNWRKGHGYKIAAKHIDFVIFDKETSHIVLCIELDDKSHTLPLRIQRDIFVNNALGKAKVPFLRLPVAFGYDMAFLQKEIRLAITKNS